MGRFLTRDTWAGNYNRPLSLNRWNYTEGNPVNYTDPSGRCIFTGVDTVACLIALAIGIPAIAGVTTAAWDYSVTQGGGYGGVNWDRAECIDLYQVLEAGKGGSLGALSSEGRTIASIALTPTYLTAYMVWGYTPTKVNQNLLSAFGLDDEYRTALRNPHFYAGQKGGDAGMTYISLATFLKGLPTGFKYTSTSVSVPSLQSGGLFANRLILTLPGVEAIGGSGELIYIGTAGMVPQFSMMSGGGGGSDEFPELVDGAWMSEDEVLDAANRFLGPGYKYKGNGRFVSADGLRQFRIGDSDILGYHGGGPHANFEFLAPNPANPGKMMITKDIHIYLER